VNSFSTSSFNPRGSGGTENTPGSRPNASPGKYVRAHAIPLSRRLLQSEFPAAHAGFYLGDRD
jgi:hypothetical protein